MATALKMYGKYEGSWSWRRQKAEIVTKFQMALFDYWNKCF